MMSQNLKKHLHHKIWKTFLEREETYIYIVLFNVYINFSIDRIRIHCVVLLKINEPCSFSHFGTFAVLLFQKKPCCL